MDTITLENALGMASFKSALNRIRLLGRKKLPAFCKALSVITYHIVSCEIMR